MPKTQKRDNGGPAFPEIGSRGKAAGGEGLSVLDYFAAKVLQGMSANESWVAYARGFGRGRGASPDEACMWTAREAYRMADAMLVERQKERT